MLGRELRAIREALGLSKTAFGMKMGAVNRKTVYRWETGRTPVPVLVAERAQSLMGGQK